VSFVAAAAVISTVAACGGGNDDDGGGGGGGGENEASDIGITEDSIKLGAHYPLTGVAAPGYSEIPLGVDAYFDYVNENGGVYDREIDYIYRDDAYNPTNTSQVVNQLVLEDEVFAIVGGLGTPTHSAVLAEVVVLEEQTDLGVRELLGDVLTDDLPLALVVGLPAERVRVGLRVVAPQQGAGGDEQVGHALAVEEVHDRAVRRRPQAAADREDLVHHDHQV
jgi:hypothetical protein